MSTARSREAIEALLATLRPSDEWPAWVRQPADEAQFAASLIAHCADVRPVYDEHGRLVAYARIRLRGAS
jgi:hypothetical protein